jgi:fructokinase
MAHVLCFGEVLWDLLPHGRFLGGAPLNVAYHLAQLGRPAALVSAVGRDALGDAALAAIAERGVDAAAIGRHARLPTGTAVVELDAGGQARFRIEQPVAWDEIDVTPALAGSPPAAIVFGTLALRAPANRTALARLLDAFPAAWVVCDLNLRPPFDKLAPLAPLLARANLLKLNADEARRLCGRGAAADDWRAMAAELAAQFHGAAICITLGADGAALREGEGWHTAAAPRVSVRDTIGAGDAFTAALVAGRLRGPAPEWPRILRAACALGGFVASHDGAQPPHGDFRPEW